MISASAESSGSAARPTRVVLHADMDAFYASVEQRDHPELRGQPVIVGGTGSRGVVSAASYEARAFGVRSAMPTFEARRRCPDGVFVRGSMQRYARESKRIFEVFGRFTPVVQGLSLDEAFLDISGTERLFGPPSDLGRRLKREVRVATELVVSVGIAPVKMVAKIASDLSKPDGLLEVKREGVREFLDPLPVGRLWGVGPVTAGRLESAGFRTVGDLAGAEPEQLESLLGSWGVKVAALSRGDEVGEVEPYREPVSYSEENTFGGDVSDRAVLRSTIIAHAEAVSRRLRSDGLRARTVVLKLKLARRRAPGPRGYPVITRRVTLNEATDDGDAVARAAFEQLDRADLREPVRLIGVGATNLVDGHAEQLGLFAESGPAARRRRINRALDELTRRFGTRAVLRGGPADTFRASLSQQIKRGEELP
ncbi:MAG: DNA polymerase IV [Myxococcota bacterium]